MSWVDARNRRPLSTMKGAAPIPSKAESRMMLALLGRPGDRRTRLLAGLVGYLAQAGVFRQGPVLSL